MKHKLFGRTGNFGTGWGHGADADTSRAIFDAYANAGGNFIDTADVYQFGQSETLLGDLLQGRREAFVLATKFTNGAVPMIGPRTLDQPRSNLAATALTLSAEEIGRLDSVSATPAGVSPLSPLPLAHPVNAPRTVA